MLTSPRRIAVVILATLAGLAAQKFLGWHDAALTGLLLGMLASLFVPTRRSAK